MQSTSLPWQVCKRALLLLLVEGAQQLQLNLSVLCHQANILQPNPWWTLSHWHNDLWSATTKSWLACPEPTHLLCQKQLAAAVSGLTTGISAGLKSVTPGSISLINCCEEAEEVFLLMPSSHPTCRIYHPSDALLL